MLFENDPNPRSAGHGGMRRASASSLIASAQGRACAYVTSGIAILPSAWHCTHFRWSSAAISRLKSTVVVVGLCG